MTTTLLCDFCSEPNPTWRYECKDGTPIRTLAVAGLSAVGHYDWQSVGDWAACDKCHEIISNVYDGGVEEHLVERSVASFFVRNPSIVLPIGLITASVRAAQRSFWSTWTGAFRQLETTA